MEVETHRPPPPPMPLRLSVDVIDHVSDSMEFPGALTGNGSDSTVPSTRRRECGSSDNVSISNGDERVEMDVSEAVAVSGSVGSGLVESHLVAAMKLQKVYRSYRTRRMLADSIIVAEELWWQVLESVQLNHSTTTFFSYSERETVASRWIRISLNASKVGKGLSNDAKAQKLAFQHWIEAIDPRHRYGHNLHLYCEEWRKAHAGQPFFYWLDIGDGKDIEVPECPRSKLRKQCIKYLGPQEREHYEYIIVEGKIVHRHSGKFLDTFDGLPGTKWIFVMSTSKRLYAGEKKKGKFHHSSFLAGGATLAAGRLTVENGVLKSISAYSGHYRPTDDSLESFLAFLKDNGVKLDEIEVFKASEDYDIYEESKSMRVEPSTEISVSFNFPQPDNEDEKGEPSQLNKASETEAKTGFIRTLSEGLRSPKAEVPTGSILQRINSKKTAKSYQLGHQLSRKWSTGAGPRIGCIADYPVELRLQALEFTHLSPRSNSPTSSSFRLIGGLASPTGSILQADNGVLTSTDI